MTRALEQFALELYERYVVEFVEAFNLCPWASEARLRGEVRVEVLRGCPPSQATFQQFIDDVAADEALNIGIAVMVDMSAVPRADWQSIVAGLQRDESRRHRGGEPKMAMAAFHPDAADDISTDGRLTAYIRRSPDVTLQLVRRSTLASVRGDASRRTAFYDPRTMDLENFLASRRPDDLAQRLVASNRRTLERQGLERVSRLLRELRQLRQSFRPS